MTFLYTILLMLYKRTLSVHGYAVVQFSGQDTIELLLVTVQLYTLYKLT